MILADRQAVEAIVNHLIKPASMPLLQVKSFSETQRTSANAELQRRQWTLLDNMRGSSPIGRRSLPHGSPLAALSIGTSLRCLIHR